MPRRADFDEEAMERKIKKNLDAGFSLEQIRLLLLEEQAEAVKKVRIHEERALELTDQLDYIAERYPG